MKEYSSESKYVYPGTDVLINLPGIRDPEQLERFERTVTAEKLTRLKKNPIQGSFDFKHLQDIHRFLFEDIYPFAGKLRDENIAKDYFSFAPVQFLESSAHELFRQLRQEKYLQGLSVDQFADRAAYYMAEMNVLHPFREGNGRTQREFIRELAQHAGFTLDWSRVDQDKLFQASVRSKVDTRDLAAVIREAIQEANPVQKHALLLLKDLIKQVDGMPSIRNAVQLDAKMLNQEVAHFQVQKKENGHLLQVQLKNDSKRLNIQMDPVPYLNPRTKAQWIEQAAKGIRSIEMDRGLDFTK